MQYDPLDFEIELDVLKENSENNKYFNLIDKIQKNIIDIVSTNIDKDTFEKYKKLYTFLYGSDDYIYYDLNNSVKEFLSEIIAYFIQWNKYVLITTKYCWWDPTIIWPWWKGTIKVNFLWIKQNDIDDFIIKNNIDSWYLIDKLLNIKRIWWFKVNLEDFNN